ncbi:MAG: diguanylate cyclase [Clostridium butyricum]|nr:diguanylate cyclase [Clostridium butyricum]
MRTINNKYLIDYEINSEENFREYAVTKNDNNKRYILCILKNDFTYEKTGQYLLSNFKSIKNLNFENVVNVLDIEIIDNVDGIKLDKPQYGYLLEFIKPKSDTLKYLQRHSASKKLDIFMEFAAAVNTLNMNGYVFNYISLKDVMLVSDKDGKVKVKIKNLLQREINKFTVVNASNDKLPYSINIEKGEESTYKSGNISEIIHMFNQLFSKKELKEELKELQDIKKVFSKINTINNFFKIKYFIKYINEKCKKNYKEFTSDALNTIVNDIDMVGFEDEVKFVEKSYASIIENREKYKIIEFNGDSGSGKTRLLNEVNHILEAKYFANVIYFPDYRGKYTNYELYDIYLKRIYSYLDKNLIDKYGIYLNKLLELITHTDSIVNDNAQVMQLINRVGKLIREYTMSRPLVVLVDDLEKRDKLFIRILKYLSFWGKNIENLIIIFTINESESSEKFLSQINEIKHLDKFEEYKISFLNQYDTAKMIRNMLKTNNDLSKLTNRIYSETLGNPQYIQEIVNELYSNKSLYFNNITGVWEFSIDDKETLIPRELEQKLEGYLSQLDEHEVKVLKKLSIFQIPLSEKIIYEDLLIDEQEINIFKQLKNKGYFIDKISDQGMLVGFANDLLRNILYLKLSSEERINMHYNACIFMEREIKESDYYIEDFLLHLNKCEQKQKLLIYMKKYAMKLENRGELNKSIKYFNECLKYCDDKEAVNIDIIIAKQYEKMSNHENSYKYFENAIKRIEAGNYDLKIKIYVALEMIIIKINVLPANNAIITKKLEEIRKMLDSIYYPVGEAYYYYAKALNLRLTNDRKELVINAEKALSICENNNIDSDIYGWITITLGIIYSKYKEIDECKQIVRKAIENFKQNSNFNGIIISELVYIELEAKNSDMQSILKKYFELDQLCAQKKYYKKKILVLNDIAVLYLSKNDYDSAEKYLLKILSIQREEGINSYSIRICNSLTRLYVKWGKINEAVKYYYLSCHMQQGIRMLEDDFIYKNIVAAEYNDMIYNYRTAFKLMNDIFKLIETSKLYKYRRAIGLYYELKLYSCTNEKEIENIYNKIVEESNILNDKEKTLKIKINLAKRILDLGYYAFSKKIFNNLEKELKDYNTQGIYLYLELTFKGKEYYNFLINKALRISNYITDKRVNSDLLYIVGVKYSELKCYALAVNYYCESISIHIGILNALPPEDKIIYANESNFLECRKRIIECLRNYLNIDLTFTNVDFVVDCEQLNNILDELDLKKILKNEKAYSLLQKVYENCYYSDFSSIYNLFDGFSDSIEENLKNILKYMARITFANKGVIIAENNEGVNKAVCSYRIIGQNEINKYLSWKFESEEDTVLLENNNDSLEQLGNRNVKGSIKACLYMKLRNKDINARNSNLVNARLILVAENAVNYINSDSEKIIEKFKAFLVFLLEKYNLTILSTLDKLTGVYNRKYFEEALISLINTSRIEKKQFAVIMFDIDNFKGVNDKYGHQTGDEVLIKLTKEVKRSITKKEVIGRYGGEEFIVLVPDVNEEKALNLAEKIRINVDNAKILGEKRAVTISVGIAIGKDHSLTPDQLIKMADEALYKSKHDGKNRCTVWKKNYVISNTKISNNEFADLLSGNIAKNYNLFSTMKDISDLIKIKEKNETRIYKFISKIMQVIECDTATVFIVKNENIINTFSKERAKEGFNIAEKFNFEAIDECILNKKGMYLVDWGNIDNHNIHGVPDWKSICLAPIVYDGQVKAVLYLSVSVNNKEFNESDLSILNCFIDVAVPIFC